MRSNEYIVWIKKKMGSLNIYMFSTLFSIIRYKLKLRVNLYVVYNSS